MKTKYKVGQYSEQANASKGIAAGMWFVERIRREVIAFGDDRAQVEQIAASFRASDETNEKSDSGLW